MTNTESQTPTVNKVKLRREAQYQQIRRHYEDALQPVRGGKELDVPQDYINKAVNTAAAAEMRTKIGLEYDEKTGLEKSGAYFETLAQRIADYNAGETPYLAVAKLDIDLFSWMNDVLKCTTLGDLTLGGMGNIINTHLRLKEGDRAFRKSGEEFGIILGSNLIKSKNDAARIVRRLLTLIRNNLLEETVSSLEGDRTVFLGKDGKKIEERIGTPILKEFAKAILAFRQPGGDEYLLRRAKGTEESRRVLRERINNISIDDFERYSTDNRLWGELNDQEKEERLRIEKRLGQAIRTIYERITCSAGLIVLGQEDKSEKDQIKLYGVERVLDNLSYSSKDYGGDTLFAQFDQRGELNHISEDK